MLCNTWAMTFWHHICVSLCSTPVEVTQAIPFRDPAKSPLVFLKSSVYSSCINHSLLCPFISFCFTCLTCLASSNDAWDGGAGKKLWNSLAQSWQEPFWEPWAHATPLHPQLSVLWLSLFLTVRTDALGLHELQNFEMVFLENHEICHLVLLTPSPL